MRTILIALALYASGWAVLLFAVMFLLALAHPYPVETTFQVAMACGLVVSVWAFRTLLRLRRKG